MATPTSRASSPTPNGGGAAGSAETPAQHRHQQQQQQKGEPTTIVIDSGGTSSSSSNPTSSSSSQSYGVVSHQPLHLQQMVKSLQSALQKKNEECAFWRDLYTNLVSQKAVEGGTAAAAAGKTQLSSSAAVANNHGGQRSSTGPKNSQDRAGSSNDNNRNGGGGKDPKRALEEATGYFATEMANKKLKTEQHTTVMKEKLGKVLEQLSRQQQLVKEKDQQMVLLQKQYEMDIAKRDHELHICKLEKNHAVELAQLQVKVQYLEAGPVGNSMTLPTAATTTPRSSRSSAAGGLIGEIQDQSKYACLQKEITNVRQDVESKLSNLSKLQDSKLTGLKNDHEAKIARLRLDLETRLLTSSSAAAGGSNPEAAAIAAAAAAAAAASSSNEDSILQRGSNYTSSSVTPEKPPNQLRQMFDCQGDCDNSKLFSAKCPLLTAGGVYKWSMRIHRRNGSPRLGVISSACTQLDSGKWLGEAGIGWGYSDWGQTWYEGRHIKTDLPRFDEGDKVTFTLDLTGSGTLSASVNDDIIHLLFFDMLAKLSSSMNGGGGNAAPAGFYPAATLLNSRVEFTDFESY